MESVDDKIRELVRDEIHKVRPLYIASVEAANTYASYETDFFAASIKKMQNYQDAHRLVFCKGCVSQGPKDRLSYRRLVVELVPDLLGNDTMQVRSQCSRCDFDMYIVATPALIQVDEDNTIEWNRLRAAIFSARREGCSLEHISGSLQRIAGEHSRAALQRAEMQKMSSMQGALAQQQQQAYPMWEQAAAHMQRKMDTEVFRAALSSAGTVKAKKGKRK